MSKEALKLALEALENHPGNYKLSKTECAEYRAVEDAIREALAEQPAQRTWQGLTDEEFQWIYDHGRTPAGMMELVEAKLKEKNNG